MGEVMSRDSKLAARIDAARGKPKNLKAEPGARAMSKDPKANKKAFRSLLKETNPAPARKSRKRKK